MKDFFAFRMVHLVESLWGEPMTQDRILPKENYRIISSNDTFFVIRLQSNLFTSKIKLSHIRRSKQKLNKKKYGLSWRRCQQNWTKLIIKKNQFMLLEWPVSKTQGHQEKHMSPKIQVKSLFNWWNIIG